MRVDSFLRLGGGVLLLAGGCTWDGLPHADSVPGSDVGIGRDASLVPIADAGVRPVDAWRAPSDAAPTDAPAYPSRALPETSTLHASLLVTADGARAVVADVDGSCLYVLDLTSSLAAAGAPPCIVLPDRSMPWRMVEDGAGRVHVVLRGSGQLATLERGASTASTRALCSEPRGLAWRASDDTILVACAEGAIVTLPASGGPATRVVASEDDLRDVVVTATDRVLISRFRQAEVIEVDGDGHVLARWQPPSQQTPDILAAPGTPLSAITARQTLAPHVAWRMLAMGDEVWLLHQGHRVEGIPPIPPDAGVPISPPYGTTLGSTSHTTCGAIVQSVLTRIDLGAPGTIASSLLLPNPVAVDLVARPSADALAIVHEGGVMQIALDVARSETACVDVAELELTRGALDAIGFVAPRDTPLALTRGPLRVELVPSLTEWSQEWVVLDERPIDRGRVSFNRVAPSGFACMSCHPEGGDDGHVWTNLPRAPVRTQAMRGGILAGAPFHWEGDLGTFDALVDEVWTLRMGGSPFLGDDRTVFGNWVDGIPAATPPSEPLDAVARGRALFESSEVGCATCHSGPRFTNDLTLDVGTGDGAFQVPSLRGVAYRAPYLHSGCAATLRDRFVADPSCTGGETHGHVSSLSAGDVDDLVSYLRTL